MFHGEPVAMMMAGSLTCGRLNFQKFMYVEKFDEVTFDVLRTLPVTGSASKFTSIQS